MNIAQIIMNEMANQKFEVTYVNNEDRSEKKKATFTSRSESELRSAFRKLHPNTTIIQVKKVIGEAEEQDLSKASAEQVKKVLDLLGLSDEKIIGITKAEQLDDMYDELADGLSSKVMNNIIGKLKTGVIPVPGDEEE
jgi:Asp-tRNA(Asn)/Glu-tRNA(Gln) amidotransferase B subunit